MSPVSAKSLAQSKVRRQKQFIAVGSVILLAVLGYELPKFLSHGAHTASAVSTVSTSVAGSPPVAAGKLPNTDLVVIQRDSNQLLSFGLFKSKDPFIQQLSTNASGTAASPAAATVKSPPSPPTTTTVASNPPASPGAPVTTTGSPGTTPATTTAAAAF